MQDRYAGDIGDYGKFGLLKALQAEGFLSLVRLFFCICNRYKRRYML